MTQQNEESALAGIEPERNYGPTIARNWPAGDVMGKGLATTGTAFQKMGEQVLDLQRDKDGLISCNNQLRKENETLSGKISSLELDLEDAELDLHTQHQRYEDAVADFKKMIADERSRSESASKDADALRRELASALGALRLITAVIDNQRLLSSE